MEEVIRAILCSYPGPGNPIEVQHRALSFLEEFENTRDAPSICLNLLFATDGENAQSLQFYATQALLRTAKLRWNVISESDRESIMGGLLKWVSSSTASSTAIRNKVAQLLVYVWLSCFPDGWASFFPSLFSMAQDGVAQLDMLLRVFEAIDEEVIHSSNYRDVSEVGRSNAVKDYLRDGHVPTIVQLWHSILTSFRDTIPELVNRSLKVFAPYIEWIDLGYIVNDTFLPALYALVERREYRSGVYLCLIEVCDKGMPPLDKLELLSRLKIPMLVQLGPEEAEMEQPDFFQAKARLFNEYGTHLVSGWWEVETAVLKGQAAMESAQQGRTLMDDALALLMRYISLSQVDIVMDVLQFLTSYVNKLRETSSSVKRHSAKVHSVDDIARDKRAEAFGLERRALHIHTLCDAIFQRVQYPVDYNYEEKDDYEMACSKLRSELKLVFIQLFCVDTAQVMQFLQQKLELGLKGDSVGNFKDFATLEAALMLYHSVFEGSNSLVDTLRKDTHRHFGVLLGAVIGHMTAPHPHPEVATLYLELLQRYSRFLPRGEAEEESLVFRRVLEAFLGGGGVRHSAKKPRLRACALLPLLLASVRPRVASLAPLVLESLQELLHVTPQVEAVIGFDSQLFLFDAVSGIIQCSAGGDARTKVALLGRALEPLVGRMETILREQLYLSDTPENPVVATIMCQHVNAFGCLCRQVRELCGADARCVTNALQVSLAALKAVPTSEKLRQKVFFLLQTHVQCIKDDIVPLIPDILELVLALPPSLDHLLSTTRWITQCVNVFKEKVAEVVHRVLPIVHDRVQEAITPRAPAPSEERSEQTRVQREFYTLVQALFQKDMAGVLATPETSDRFQAILVAALQGVMDDHSAQLQKLCLHILAESIRVWANAPAGPLTSFAVEQILPVLFEFGLSMDLKDGFSCMVLLKHVANIHLIMASQCGDLYVHALTTNIFPKLGINMDDAMVFLQTVSLNDASQLMNMLKNTFEELQARRSTTS